MGAVCLRPWNATLCHRADHASHKNWVRLRKETDMSNLVRTKQAALDRRVGNLGGSRVSRDIARRAQQAAGDGLVAATRIQAVAYCGNVALNEVAMLSSMEGELIKRAPLGEARYQAIVDTVAGVMASEIARLM